MKAAAIFKGSLVLVSSSISKLGSNVAVQVSGNAFPFSSCGLKLNEINIR